MGGQRGQGDPPDQIINLLSKGNMITTQEGHTITVFDNRLNILFNNSIEVEVKLNDDEIFKLANDLADIHDQLNPKKHTWKK